MLPCRLRRRKLGKFGYEVLYSKVCLNKYVVSTAPFSYPAFTPRPFRKLVFFACFRFLIFHPFFQRGQLTTFAPYVRTPMRTSVSEKSVESVRSKGESDLGSRGRGFDRRSGSGCVTKLDKLFTVISCFVRR